jgi:hypothetical protein
LEEDLVKKNRDLKAAQYNVTSARQETTKLKTKQDSDLKQQRDELLAKHSQEIETLNMKADENAEGHKRLSARVKKLKTSNEKVGLLIENKEMQRNLSDQEVEIQSLKDRCKVLYSMYADEKLKSQSWVDAHGRIEKEIEALKEKHELQLLKQKPLLLIGVIKRRFLMQARSVLPPYIYTTNDQEKSESWGNGDKAIMDLGIAAAHFGNSDADAALFTCGFSDDEEGHSELFKAIYQLHPTPSRL